MGLKTFFKLFHREILKTGATFLLKFNMSNAKTSKFKLSTLKSHKSLISLPYPTLPYPNLT
jgi:hypothetical protein